MKREAILWGAWKLSPDSLPTFPGSATETSGILLGSWHNCVSPPPAQLLPSPIPRRIALPGRCESVPVAALPRHFLREKLRVLSEPQSRGAGAAPRVPRALLSPSLGCNSWIRALNEPFLQRLRHCRELERIQKVKPRKTLQSL